jgi:hypothetical protein
MARTLRILGQIAAASASEEDLYTVPTATETMVSTLVVCNRTTGSLDFRVSLTVNDVPVTTDKDYIFYNAPLAANSTITVTIGMTLATNDTMRVYASATGLSFNLFGSETT